MADTFEQHHFNTIIDRASKIYALELLLKAARRHCVKTEEQLNGQVLAAKDITDTFGGRLPISPETRLKGNELVEQYNLALDESKIYYALVMNDHTKAVQQLKIYLDNYSERNVRKLIYDAVNDIKNGTPALKFDNDVWFDAKALDSFQIALAQRLNKLFAHNYNYTPPASNNFIITFLTHPIVRGLNSLILVGGLAALTIGIIAAAGLITSLPATIVASLITGGAVATVSGLALLSCGFFRHRSPEELASRCEKISIPNMTPDVVIPMGSPASNEHHVEHKKVVEEEGHESDAILESSSPH